MTIKNYRRQDPIEPSEIEWKLNKLAYWRT